MIFITGGNRGIGLELVRHYLTHTDKRVWATYRTDADELAPLQSAFPQRLKLSILEVTDEAGIAEVVSTVRRETDHLEVLINNAGINPPGQSLASITSETLLHVLHVNTVAPLLLTRAFQPLLTAGTKVVMVSSQLGSLSRKASGGRYAYDTSKAALNMVTRALAHDLRGAGVITITLHPGWVQTDMGGSNATLTPVESARGISQVIARLTPADNGKYYDWKGDELPW